MVRIWLQFDKNKYTQEEALAKIASLQERLQAKNASEDMPPRPRGAYDATDGNVPTWDFFLSTSNLSFQEVAIRLQDVRDKGQLSGVGFQVR